MRLIDADALTERINNLKSMICSRAAGWVDEDSYECGAVDGLLDALKYIEEAKEAVPRLLTPEEVKTMEAGTPLVVERYIKHDGRELIRCRDCKHREESVSPSWEAWCNRLHCGCDNDWFCADGERR